MPELSDLNLNKQLYRESVSSDGDYYTPESLSGVVSGSSSSSSSSSSETVPESITSGELLGNLIMVDGFIRSKDYIANTSGWTINADGSVEFDSGYFRGDITGASGTFSGTLTGGSLNIPDTTTASSFHVDTNGNTWWGTNIATGYATALAKILATGAATFKSATIGNWTVNTTSIYTGTEDHSGYTANAGDMTLYSDGSDASIHANQFYIDNTGSIYATNGAFTGTLTIGGRLATIIGGAINANGDYINNLINARIDTDTKTILSDFNFGTTDYAGAVKAGDITWNTTTGAITGGSGVAVYRGGIVGAKAGVETFSISASTGDATFAGTLSAASGTLGTITSATSITGTINATSGKFGTATNYWSVGATGLTAVSASTDVILNYGKTDFTNTDAGFILGYDYSATKAKFYIGNNSEYFNYDGTDFTLVGGTITGGIIQTATSGVRIELDSGGFESYDASNNSLVQITTGGLFQIQSFDGNAPIYSFARKLNANHSFVDTAAYISDLIITDGNTYTAQGYGFVVENQNPEVTATAAFTGTGTITIDSQPTGFNYGIAAKQYKIEIDGVGDPNTFKWSDDNGLTWEALTVAIDSANHQTLTSGDGSNVILSFSANTGGVAGDYWTFTTGAVSSSGEYVMYLKQMKASATGAMLALFNRGTGRDVQGNDGNWYAKPDGTFNCAELQVDGDIGGLASTNSLTGISNLTANSTGVGTIKFKGTGSRDSSGFIKVYIGTTAYYVPVFNDITT